MMAGAKKGYRDKPFQGMAGREDSTDPLRIKAKPGARKQAARRRKAIQRGGTLERLYNLNAIDQAQYLSGCKIRTLVAETKGDMPSTSSFATERVDGGGNKDRDWLILGVTDAQRRLSTVQRFVGFTDYIILMRVCGEGESLASIALDYEEDPKRKSQGKASRQTDQHVSRRLRDALKSVSYVLGMAVKGPASDLALDLAYVSNIPFVVPEGFVVRDGMLVEVAE